MFLNIMMNFYSVSFYFGRAPAVNAIGNRYTFTSHGKKAPRTDPGKATLLDPCDINKCE